MTNGEVMTRACAMARAALEEELSRPGEADVGRCICGAPATWVDLKIQSNGIVIVTRPRCEAHK